MQLKRSRSYYIYITWLLVSLFFLPALSSFGQKKASGVVHPGWSRNLTMYEVNLRQYTKGGTFREFEARLPELKKMGIGVLWFMPINPIGEKNRKGSLGSYYSVKDYLKVNPDYGTLNDFKSLVKKIHQSGMYVIIDWVANHTSWDNVLTESHPEYFVKDSAGHFVPPVADWTDVIKLNYDNKDLWKYMTGALKYWVKETGIDGYRCDVAAMVPTAFWNEARAELDKSKKVLMLAEAETPELHQKAFDISYSWNLYHLMNDIAGAKKSAADLDVYFKKDKEEYPEDSYRLTFTTNHDENSWNGTEFERLGEGVKAFEVLSFTGAGFPLLYTGQEAGLNRRLSFFEKDSIGWQKSEFRAFYTALIGLKLKNKALLNGSAGGEMIRINTKDSSAVYAFTRERGKDKVIVVLNLSGKPQQTVLEGTTMKGKYKELFSKERKDLSAKETFSLKPWGYKIFIK